MSRKGAPFYCTYENCTSSFSRSDRLENHLRTHTGERPFTCQYPECGKRFGNSQHLKRHESTHESSFNCPIEGCSETFKRKDALKRHVDNFHHKKNPKQYKCTECDKQFNKHNWLQSHMYKHTGIFPYMCQTEGCGKGFLLPSKLKRHIKTHEGHICKIPGCGAMFFKWSLYMAHLKGFHPTVHKCNICEREFSHPVNMKTHVEMHKEPLSRKVFACDVPNCPRYYFAEKNLDWHVKTYHEARPYTCDKEHCHKAFKAKDALDQHILRHTRRKPRRKKKPKPSFSAVLSGCEDPRKFIRKMPQKRNASESSDEFTTDDEIEYQDTSSDENTNRNSASEMTDLNEMTCDKPATSQSTYSQFDEIQSGTAEPNKEKKCDHTLPEYSDLSAIEGPSTRISELEVFALPKDNHKIQEIIKPPKKRRRSETGGKDILNSSISLIADGEIISIQDNISYITGAQLLNHKHSDKHMSLEKYVDVLQGNSGLSKHGTIGDDHIKLSDDHMVSGDKHMKSGDDHMESGDDDIGSGDDDIGSGDEHIELFQGSNNSGNEENANSSEYETIKVSVFGNVCVWEKSYSGSDEVSSCLSEAEDLLNCGDVFPKRQR